LGNEENVNGFPFGVVDASVSGYVMTYVRSYDENPFTVSIYHDAETVHKLDHKYLPDGVPYCIDGVMAEVLPETTIETEADIAAIPPLGLMAGNDYVVRINGTEYTCTAFELEDDGLVAIALGNAKNMGGEDTGEPFLLAELPPEYAAQAGFSVIIQPVSEELTLPVTASISGKGVEIRKLDNRCLDLEWIPVKKQVDGDIQLESTISESSTGDGSKVSFIPEPGKAYRVTYGDKTFVSTAKAYEDGASTYWYVGNMNIIYPATFADTGEPAAYFATTLSGNPNGARFETNDGASGDTAVKICEAVYAPEKLPEKFLPDTVATKAYVEELLGVIENGTY
jgi:hypothetical protein